MLKKRIIPCLDIQNGRTVKGIHFAEMRDAGDPVELAKKYVTDGADELVFLDITATHQKRRALTHLVEKIASEINIPFTVGGGIGSIDDAAALIQAGADKLSINSSAFKTPHLIRQIAGQFGSQCAVVAIDAQFINNDWYVYIHGGKTPTGVKAIDWALQAQADGAGEILLTSINNDGAKNGFALDVLRLFSNELHIPVIASGGAGTKEHFFELFQYTNVSAALAASIFHFDEVSIPQLKSYLKTQQISIR